MRKLFIFILLVQGFIAAARPKYDSVAWYDKEHLSFVRRVSGAINIDYSFHSNGHISSITYHNHGQLSSQKIYSPAGKIVFDTVCNPAWYNWSWSYYSDGSKKRFVQEQFPKSSSQSHTGFERIEWTPAGEISHIFFKDDKGKTVADQAYPFRQFKNLQCHRLFYDNGAIKENGFYVMDSLSGTRKKYGAWITFFSNGKMESARLYMNDVPWGVHYTFDSTGTELSVKNYVQGKETDFLSDQLSLLTAATPGAPSLWRWENFTYEGIYSANGQNHYYYRGCLLADIGQLLKRKPNDTRAMQFQFPYMAFWSTWNKYTVTTAGTQIVREHEEISGSWNNFRIYDEAGRLTQSTTGSRSEEVTYHPNGKRASLIRTLHYNYQPQHYFLVEDRKQDTAFYWDESGRLMRSEVYGLYGQLRYTIEYANGQSTVIGNLLYNRVFVRPSGETRWCEVLDADVMLYGDVRVINGKKIEVFTGEFDHGRNGLWVTRHP
jgi:YD repeat-containing protein